MKIVGLVVGSIVASQVAADAMIGTNIGGWMVLEPWITPSLFYRFLGKKKSDGIGIDSYTFCEALGKEANAVMRAHWDAWLTEDHIKQLADREVEIVRLPIGDWTLTPYGPYKDCMNGAAEKIQWFLDTCSRYGIKVLLDVHALKDSQNGFDNSGKASDVVWINENQFNHWDHNNAHWMGEWDGTKYTSFNYDNIQWAVDNVRNLMMKWGNHPALYALEPVNEPWYSSDSQTMKTFYRQVRQVIREINSDIIFVFHDAFKTSAKEWNDLFDDDDTENVVLDAHRYMAWYGHMDSIQNYCDAYTNDYANNQDFQNIKYKVWIGEWSLATDNCAMWLGGFNESSWQSICEWVPCPISYMPEPFNVDFDRTNDNLGPFGTSNIPTIKQGQCQIDSARFSDAETEILGNCTRQVFDNYVDGQFLWNFRTELESRWDYIKAYDMKWLQKKQNQSTFLQ